MLVHLANGWNKHDVAKFSALDVFCTVEWLRRKCSVSLVTKYETISILVAHLEVLPYLQCLVLLSVIISEGQVLWIGELKAYFDPRLLVDASNEWEVALVLIFESVLFVERSNRINGSALSSVVGAD